MKNTLLLFFTLTAFFAFSQNVNIPDANFKAFLVADTAINTNGDTEIQVAEAQLYPDAIICPSLSISDLTGIEAFTNLTTLDFNDNNVSIVDFSNNTLLTKLKGNSNTLITDLDLSNLVNLEHLNFRFCNITAIDFTNNLLLDTINLWVNQIDSIDVSFLSNLKYLNISNNNLTSINVENNIPLIDFSCATNHLDSIEITNLTNLLKLNAAGNNLTEIDLSNNVNLTTLTLNSNNSLSQIDLTNLPALERVYLAYTDISSTDFSANPNLVTLDMYNSNFVEVDLSNNPFLTRLHAKENPFLEKLNLASGGLNLLSNYQNFNDCPILTCIQVDDVPYADANFTIKDAGTIYSLDCGYCFTSQNSIDTILCGEETYTSSSQMVYTSTGIYSDTLQNNCGEDSILEINLTVLENVISNNNGTLEATTGFDSYQWFKDANTISNETNVNFTPTESGEYHCEASKNTCSSVSNSITIDLETSINELDFENLNIYPNPTNGIINLETTEALIPIAIGTIKLFDLTGKEIKSFATETKALNISEFSTGIYFLEVANNENKSVVKIIKK